MTTNKARETIPRPYALSLWLAELGCNSEQIASVIGIEPEAVGGLLKVAALKTRRLAAELRSGTGSRSVLVFERDGKQVVAEGAALARQRRGVLHVVALHATTRRRSFAPSEAYLRRGAELREEAERRLVDAARQALLFSVDVVPHAVVGSETDALEAVTHGWGPATVVGPQGRALERACRSVGCPRVLTDRRGA